MSTSHKTNEDHRRESYRYDGDRGTCRYQCPYCSTWMNGHELAENRWYCLECSDQKDNPLW